MNRGSTAGFVHLSVYIGFPLFVLVKGRSGQLSTIPKRARGTVGFWATRPVGILFCPAQPRPAAPPCAAPTRTARDMFGFLTRQVKKMFTETNRRRQTDQQQGTKSARGPAYKPRMHRLSTAGFVLPWIYIWIRLSVFSKNYWNHFFDALEDKRDACFLSRQTRRRPVRPDSARTPRLASPLATCRSMSEFGIRQVCQLRLAFVPCRSWNLNNCCFMYSYPIVCYCMFCFHILVRTTSVQELPIIRCEWTAEHIGVNQMNQSISTNIPLSVSNRIWGAKIKVP